MAAQKTFYLETFGCQMNAHDSEKVIGTLQQQGYTQVQVEEEADLLRVHLDTARYQVLTQYPDVEPALLLNCLLLAATESSVAGDPISANYHFAWFLKLDEPPVSQWRAES